MLVNTVTITKKSTMNAIKAIEELSLSPIEKVLYTAKTHTTGGRDGGESRSSDGRLKIKLTVPGNVGDGTNPEQLLAAGWSACFISGMKIAAGKMKIKLPFEVAIDAEVDLGTTGGSSFLQSRLNIILPGLEREVAQAVVKAAHETCPYSKATRGNIGVVINVV
jgi:Ohr subfamily peroxiredoxin